MTTMFPHPPFFTAWQSFPNIMSFYRADRTYSYSSEILYLQANLMDGAFKVPEMYQKIREDMARATEAEAASSSALSCEDQKNR